MAQVPPHSLVLKVLRLQKSPVAIEEHAKPYTEEPSDSLLPFSNHLALPTSFGTCHVGETFSGLVVANNASEEAVLNATLKVEMNTAQGVVELAQIVQEGPLGPGETLQTKVQLEIKEIGQHALVCTVSYTAKVSEETPVRSFRKSYKFVTQNPLSVKTKVHHSRSPLASMSEQQKGTSYLEVQIGNASKSPLTFSRINFIPVEGTIYIDCNPYPDCLDFLYPSDVRQMLYICARDNAHEHVSASMTKGGPQGLGRLDIEWRGGMGEIGRLQTSMLVDNAPPVHATSSFNITVIQAPATVRVGEAFEVHCRVRYQPTHPVYTPVHLQVQHLAPSRQTTSEELAAALNNQRQDLGRLAGSFDSPRSSRPSSRALSDRNPAMIPSQALQLLGPTFQSLPPLLSSRMAERTFSRGSVLSTETDGTTESNEPLANIIERAASRSHSRAGSHVEDEEVAEEAEFKLEFVALEEGLLNVPGVRLLQSDMGVVKAVAEQMVLAQVWAVL